MARDTNILTDTATTSEAARQDSFWTCQAPTYAPRYEGKHNEAHAFRIRLQRVMELFDKPKGRVLDIGCGPGLMVEHLLRLECEVYGVDISEGMISECQQRFEGNPSVHLAVGQIEWLEYADALFDAVTCMGVVEYISDDDIAVKEIARVTKPGGSVIITVPNKLSPYRIWDRLVYRKLTNPVKKLVGWRDKGIWHKEYMASSYLRLLKDHGLIATDVVYYGFKVMPSPLDIFFRKLTANISVSLEPLSRHKLGWLGTGFIVKAVKE